MSAEEVKRVSESLENKTPEFVFRDKRGTIHQVKKNSVQNNDNETLTSED